MTVLLNINNDRGHWELNGNVEYRLLKDNGQLRSSLSNKRWKQHYNRTASTFCRSSSLPSNLLRKDEEEVDKQAENDAAGEEGVMTR